MPKRKQAVSFHDVNAMEEVEAQQPRKRSHKYSANNTFAAATQVTHEQQQQQQSSPSSPPSPPPDHSVVNTTNVHIKSGGRIRNYAEYCLKWLKDDGDRAVTLLGQAACVTKAVTVAELVKRLSHADNGNTNTLQPTLAQQTEIGRASSLPYNSLERADMTKLANTSVALSSSASQMAMNNNNHNTRNQPVIRITLTKLSSVMTASP
ncbi:hypothetical protein BDF19DRAFT_441691 [Syncephalis fuscata]|nr:hypothetical protein BDF19DRAFT_441691 [Syncephalis fuscata]